MNRNHHCINLQYYSSNIGVSLALSSSLARNNCTMVLSWSQFMRLQFFFLTQPLWLSKKLSSVAKRKDYQEEESGHRRYEEKWPKQPSVHRLCQHPPLSADLIIFVCLILLVQEAPDHPGKVILIVIRQTSRTIHPDHVKLGAGGLEAGGSWGWLVYPWPRAVVAEDAAHHPHELLLVVLRDPDAVPALHLHEVQPGGRGADGVANAAKERVLLRLSAATLALREASIRRGPRLPSRRLIDQSMLRLLPLDIITTSPSQDGPLSYQDHTSPPSASTCAFCPRAHSLG